MAQKTDKEKMASQAVKLFPKLQAGEITLTALATKVTGRKPGEGLNLTRDMLCRNLAEARAHFNKSKRHQQKSKKAS